MPAMEWMPRKVYMNQCFTLSSLLALRIVLVVLIHLFMLSSEKYLLGKYSVAGSVGAI